jgi:hypothetical protein
MSFMGGLLRLLAPATHRLGLVKNSTRAYLGLGTSLRHFSGPAADLDLISVSSPEGAEKEYDPKIEALVNQISALTLLQVSDLNELLKKRLNIPDVPMMGSFPIGPPQPSQEVRTKKRGRRRGFGPFPPSHWLSLRASALGTTHAMRQD